MGQMTYAVMYGAKTDEDPPELFEDGWYTLFKGFKPGKRGPEPDMNEAADVLGFWVAVGASGAHEEDVPGFDEDFPLDEIRGVAVYAKRVETCEKAWPKFEAHAKKMGIALAKPRLWLVQTEVA